MKTIPLTQGKLAQVDDDLFAELNKHKWYAMRRRKSFYAVRKIRLPSGRRPTLWMHREIFRLRGETIPDSVDHRDRNGLNNQWENLRPATRLEQQRNRGKRGDNTSGFIGVSPCGEKWEAQVGRTRLGVFQDKFAAAQVRDIFVRLNHGEFAVVNDRKVAQ